MDQQVIGSFPSKRHVWGMVGTKAPTSPGPYVDQLTIDVQSQRITCLKGMVMRLTNNFVAPAFQDETRNGIKMGPAHHVPDLKIKPINGLVNDRYMMLSDGLTMVNDRLTTENIGEPW